MRMSNDDQMQECIANCMNCYRTCEHTLVHCIKKGGEHADPDHLSLMADCAKICATSADFMIRMSKHHALTCGICAQLCDACATDCDRLADDDMMRHCADVCRRCAASCHQMSGTAVA